MANESESDRPGSSDARAENEGDQKTAPTDEKEKKPEPQQEWKWLYSSNLVQYNYDKDSKELTIIFHGNRLYHYHDVPEDVAHGLGTAASAGHYFSTKIKGKFPFSLR
jgi:hypothetical protein